MLEHWSACTFLIYLTILRVQRAYRRKSIQYTILGVWFASIMSRALVVSNTLAFEVATSVARPRRKHFLQESSFYREHVRTDGFRDVYGTRAISVITQLWIDIVQLIACVRASCNLWTFSHLHTSIRVHYRDWIDGSRCDVSRQNTSSSISYNMTKVLQAISRYGF